MFRSIPNQEVSALRTSQHRAISREISNIRKSFVTIARAFERIGPALSAVSASSTSNGRTGAQKATRRRPKLSPAQRRALKLQGRYMGTMRGLSARAQTKVKAIRKAKGIRAAIAAARNLSSR
jgi:hypothetical protein